ncbi:UvrD-C-2 multi-domain protein [Pyrenophora tritici-repentis]|nr:UvrD-C-2 multi-domain protein [Pyrenophora tritici-repentis]
MRIYAYKDDVKAYNHRRLRELGRPVLLVNTSHSGGVPAERANTEEAGNLHKEIPISINARVMLRENLWIERRLFNGAREWVRGIIRCTRTQFPITIAYAITIHKSQGLSVDTAVLNPGKKRDFQPDLTYVAISRVRTLHGILFEESFDFNRLKTKTTTVAVMRAADLTKRESQEIELPIADADELPSPFPSSFVADIGRASQMAIPVLPSEPVAPSGELGSTVLSPSGAFSGGISSDDVVGGDVVRHSHPRSSVMLVAGLVPRDREQYDGSNMLTSQTPSTQDHWF